MTDLIDGKWIRLEYDIDTLDRYGRTLSYVYLEDGTFVNASMVRNGYATVLTTPPNVRYADTFTELARKARKRGMGLWKGTTISGNESREIILRNQFCRTPGICL